MKKQAGPASVEIKTEADFDKYTKDRDASVVGKMVDHKKINTHPLTGKSKVPCIIVLVLLFSRQMKYDTCDNPQS